MHLGLKKATLNHKESTTMYSRQRNDTSSNTTIKSFLLYSFIIASSTNGFGRTSHSCTTRIRDRTSVYKPSPLYYIDHDPIIEQTIQLQPITAVTTFNDTAGTIKSKQKTTSNKQTTVQSPSKYNGTQDKTWNEQYQALLEFKQKYGHCQVPQTYPPSPKLGLWVMSQRRHFNKNKVLTPRFQHRYQLLQDIGFLFRVDRRGPRMVSLRKVNGNGRDRRGNTTNVCDMDDFVEFMVENEDRISEEEKLDAWRQRFSVYER